MKILFVCTGNTCRSPMAQAIFLQLLGQVEQETFSPEDFQVLSAGIFTHEGLAASPEAIEAMLLKGIDISDHKSQLISDELIQSADLIITMTDNHRQYLLRGYPETNNIITLSELAQQPGEDILDPYGMGLDTYIKTAEQLENLLQKVIVKILGNYKN